MTESHGTVRLLPKTECHRWNITTVNGDSEVRHEWTTVSHRLELNAKRAMTYFVNDRWNDIPYDSYLYSSAFTDCVNRRHREPAKGSDYNQTLRLIVRAPQLRSGSSRRRRQGTGQMEPG